MAIFVAMVPAASVPITSEMLVLISELDEFKGAWRSLGNLSADRLHRLQRVATIESTGSSTRIEGATLSDREVEELLTSRARSLRTRDEQEVAGYAHVMEAVIQNYALIPITAGYIKQLHAMLLRHSEKDARHRGEYKKISNRIESLDETGKVIGVVFERSSPFDTPRHMDELIAWLDECIESKEMHPLMIVAVFVVVFLAVHPFQDGNGRLSRILTSLLLLRFGYEYVSYGSLERIIEQHKEAYYLSLRRTQGTLAGGRQEWTPWIIFFLRSLQQQKRSLQVKVEHEQILRRELPELAIRILALATDRGAINVSDVMRATGAPRGTVKKWLGELARNGRLKVVGEGRGTRYIVA